MSSLLQAGGTIWIVLTFIGAVSVAQAFDRIGSFSIPAPTQMTPDQTQMLSNFFTNTTLISFVLGLAVNLFGALIIIAVGQILAMLLRIEHNTRRRSAGVQQQQAAQGQRYASQRPREIYNEDYLPHS